MNREAPILGVGATPTDVGRSESGVADLSELNRV